MAHRKLPNHSSSSYHQVNNHKMTLFREIMLKNSNGFPFIKRFITSEGKWYILSV